MSVLLKCIWSAALASQYPDSSTIMFVVHHVISISQIMHSIFNEAVFSVFSCTSAMELDSDYGWSWSAHGN